MASSAFAQVMCETFTTCPQSKEVPKDLYRKTVAEVARWSEEYGSKGVLVYTDNSIVDPWLVAQIVIENTTRLCPLVAVQPAYMHPYTVAKMVSTFGFLYGRRIYLNMVAGGFKNDLAALDDNTPHDLRYKRLIEYTTIIRRLLESPAPVTFEGSFYRVTNLRLTPPLPEELFPGIFVSGSSEAGEEAAQSVGATAIKYPKPAYEYQASAADANRDSGIRVGIIAREGEQEAWGIAHTRFPADRKGELTHQLAMKTSDSAWHKQLSEMGEQWKANQSPYWLHPFETYKTFCPYLVGSYDSVAGELSRYIAAGYRTFILDIPPERDELRHTNIAFQRASNWKRA